MKKFSKFLIIGIFIFYGIAKAQALADKEALSILVRLQQSVRDSQFEATRLQQEIDKLNRIQNQAVLQLKSDNEALKKQIAEMRSDKEKLGQEIILMQRFQKEQAILLQDAIVKLLK